MLIASHSNLRYHCNLKADFEMREASQSEIEMSKQSQTETEKFAVLRKSQDTFQQCFSLFNMAAA